MNFQYKVVDLQGLAFLHHLSLRIGILGGSFDPAHDGHRMISIQAIDYYHFDYVIWLVANQNPEKSKYKHDIYTRALYTTKIAKHPKIIVSTAELDLNTIYTYDSLKSITTRFRSCDFTWIMGIDNLLTFAQWYRSKDILELCDIIIFDRPSPNRMVPLVPLSLGIKADIAKTKTRNIIVHRGRLYDISSTFIKLHCNDNL